ncbi:MAG: hypothetical protein GXO24_05795 [Chlorobi bacterium]|nr:hypothetical protein [Chlorobiota bacterium]
MKKWILLISLNLMTWSYLSAQETAQTGDLIQGGVADANKLVDAYIAPLNKALIYSLGEFNYTGFNRFGDKKFSVGFKTVFLISPESDRTYHVNALNLETLEAEDPNNDEAQTIFGDSTSYIYIQSKKKSQFTGEPAFKFKSPTGSGYPGFPIPYIDLNYSTAKWNFSLGLIPLVPVPTTDLNIFMVRGAAQYNLTSAIGLDEKKHEISVATSAGYFHGYSLLDVKPSGVTVNASTSGNQSGPYDNQKLLLDYTSFSLATHYAYLFGKHYRIYVGGGMVAGNSSLKLVGTYPIYESDPTGSFSVVAEDIDDPLDIQNAYFAAFGEAGIRADWKKWYLQLQANIGNYTGGSLGIGYKF